MKALEEYIAFSLEEWSFWTCVENADFKRKKSSKGELVFMIEISQELDLNCTWKRKRTMKNLLSLLCYYLLQILFQSKYQVIFRTWVTVRFFLFILKNFCFTLSYSVIFYVQVYGNYSRLPKHPGKDIVIYHWYYHVLNCYSIFI